MPSSLDLNLGSIVVGTLLSSVLFGMVTVQLYLYWQSHYEDKFWTRCAVAISWVLELLWTLTTWIYLYSLVVTSYGQPAALIEPSWTLAVSCAANGIIGAIVQGWFAYRVRVLSGRWIITIVAWTGSLLQLTGLISIGVLGQSRTLPVFAEEFNWLMTCVIVFDLCVDLLNTVSLCYYFRSEKTGMDRTNYILDRLFVWTIQTGLIITVTALIMLIFQLALPVTEMWIGVSLFYGKLYSNSFMASLNGRKSLRRSKLDTMSSSHGTGTAENVSLSVIRSQGGPRIDMTRMVTSVPKSAHDQDYPQAVGFSDIYKRDLEG